jgi:hypothetical protein
MAKAAIQKFQTPWLYATLGGLIFLLIFYIAYAQIDSNFYQHRDDGLITLSHAKNWIDFGFIGVNPSGERLEGYSAPVQFFLFALAYLLSGISYTSFMDWQTLLGTFLLGYIFVLYFVRQPYFALGAASLAAIALTLCTSFLEWHASGMENAITHVLFAGSVYLLYRFALKQKIQFAWVFIFVLASLSRLDGIYHIFPILLCFAFYWYFVEKKWQGFYLLGYFVLLWLAYQGWRYYYFGSLASNTLLAQQLNVGGRLEAIFTLQRWYFLDALQLSKVIWTNHAGVLLWLIVPLAFLARWKRTTALLFTLCICLVMTASFNPLLFGETRLDPTRSTTQMAFFVLVAFFCVVQNCSKRWLAIVATVLMLPLLIWMRTAPYYICCGVTSFSPIADEARVIAQQQDLFRPSFANPDLGVISWNKEFNLLDLGMLGSSIFAKVRQGPILADYFFDFAAPDIIETHETWSCQYWHTLFSDPRFEQRYRPMRQSVVRYGSCQDQPLPKGIWVRRDIEQGANTAERRLIDDLKKNLTTERLAQELARCRQTHSQAADCAYVARAAYRYLPEFKKQGKAQDLVNVFDQSQSRPFDQFLLTGYANAQAYQVALDWLTQRYLKLDSSKSTMSSNGFEIGIDRHFLMITKSDCKKADLKQPFLIRYKDGSVKAQESFDFLQKGFEIGSTCIASVPIGSEKMQSIESVGQWVPKEGRTVWQVNFESKPKSGSQLLKQ